jgi:hypothetical protein
LERGYPAGEVAHVLILKSLIERDLGFEELVNTLEGQLSRGTVNKYLNSLYEGEGRFRDFVKRHGRRGSYYVPREKRGEVELFIKREETKKDCNLMIDNATVEEIEKLRTEIQELKRLTFPLYLRLEAALFYAKYEARVYPRILEEMKKSKFRRIFSPMVKADSRKLAAAAEARLSELKPQVESLRKFFDQEMVKSARKQVLLNEAKQVVGDTTGLRSIVYAELEKVIEKHEQELQ